MKAVVDVERGLIVVDAEMHFDQEAELLARALELLDLTLADPRLRGSVAQLREVARARGRRRLSRGL